MKKHFVNFLSPGTFFSEATTKPIDSWNVQKAVKMAKKIKERHNATPYGFYFSTNARSSKDLDSKEVKKSAMYFLGGRVMTLAEVEKEMPSEQILISNMRNNKIKRIIVNTNSWKVTLPFDDKDTLLQYD